MEEGSIGLAQGGLKDWHRHGREQKELRQEKPSRRPRGRHLCSLLIEQGGDQSEQSRMRLENLESKVGEDNWDRIGGDLIKVLFRP